MIETIETEPGRHNVSVRTSSAVYLLNNLSYGADDTDLVRKTLAGQSRAYEPLVRRYQKLVYNMIFQMVRSHEMAADLTQETFLRAYRGLAGFKQDAKFKPWLLRIATNTCLNAIRDQKPCDSLEKLMEDNPHAEPPSAYDLENEVDWRLSQQMLGEALAALPVRHRHVFLLRYAHDLSYEEISEVIGEPITTIKPLLFRIRERLRRELQKNGAKPQFGEAR